MNRLRDHFDRVVVISLPEREERRERLLRNLTDTGLAGPEDLTWLDAVDGRRVNIPDWWVQGPGAWGCRFSQLRALEEAHRDGLETLLILEDDAVFHPRAGEWLPRVMDGLPDDWGQLFLGGQYWQKPTPTRHPAVWQSRAISRTHAYAIHRRIIPDLVALVADDEAYRRNPGWHVDHQYCHHQQLDRWKTYAPAWWLAGQEAGETDIGVGEFPRRWWQWGFDFWKLPFIRLPDDRIPHPDLLCLTETPASREPFELAHWFRRGAYEAWCQGRLPALRETTFTHELIARLWPAGSLSAPGNDAALAALADYPANGLFPHPFSKTTTHP